MAELLPWHTAHWVSLQQRRNQERLPHALLFSGPRGTGKLQFALILAQSFLCKQNTPEGLPCGQCSACQLYKAGTHPDIEVITPEKSAEQIKIDQIRGLIDYLALSSHSGGYKLVILQPAEAMNTAAANSLLKTLEEPPAKTLLMLLSAQPSRLPATIRSRCQLLRFNAPRADEAVAWLAEKAPDARDPRLLLSLAGGAPLHALEIAESTLLEQRQQLFQSWLAVARGEVDPVKTSAEWLKLEEPMPITWLYGWIGDIIRLKLNPAAVVGNPDLHAALQQLAQDVDLIPLYRLLDRVTEALQLLGTQINMQTLLEGLLINWANLPRQNR